MKMTLGIILGVVIGAIVLIAIIVLVVFAFILPAARAETTGTTAGPITSTITASTAQPSATPPRGSLPTTTLPISVTPKGAVDFDLQITGMSGSDLTRTVTAQITNTGTIDAHNVSAKIEVFSGGSRIKVNGSDYITQTAGTIKAGATTNSQVSLTFSFFDVPRLLSNGANFTITINSDEKARTFNYDYQP
jgi:hypothetical protein